MTTLCAGIVLACAAQAQETPLTLGAGLHYSSGDYGTGSTTRITALAATARYETGPWIYRATLPYLRIDGESAVIPGVGAVRGGSTRRTASGLGDLVLGATYEAYYDPASTLGLDLTGKLKLATADEAKGLGTGEHDMVFLAELYRSFERLTGFGGIGYHLLGEAPGSRSTTCGAQALARPTSSMSATAPGSASTAGSAWCPAARASAS